MKLPNNTTVRVYDEGGCFGEESILNDSPNTMNAIASENCLCYILPKFEFLELLKDQRTNDYMKYKMITEDTEVQISHLSKLQAP